MIFTKSVKKIFFSIGLSLVFIGVIVFVIFFFFFPKMHNNHNANDDNFILRNGKLIHAKINRVITKKNITDNGINPKVINYQFMDSNKIYDDNFQTLEISRLDSLEQKDSIEIYLYKGQTLIREISRYETDLSLFWLLPILLCSMGILMIFISKLLK